jgi:hypothetical protein
VHADITALTAARQRRLEVGARVEILQHKHLRCARTGHVQSINGAYIQVRPDDQPVVASNPTEAVFELYPNELRVLAVYRHQLFQPGVVVRIKNLNWGTHKPKSNGIVQPVGARKGAIVSLVPEDLVLESNEGGLPAEALVSQRSILALLRALETSTSLTELKALLATQSGVSDVDGCLARLANEGKVTLSESRAQAVESAEGSCPDPVHVELHSSILALSEAQDRLAQAVHQAIVQAS